MFKKIILVLQKYPFLKFLTNKYYLIGILFIVWMLFFDNISFFEHQLLNNQISELEKNGIYYQENIKTDSVKIKNFNNPFMIEKYAREKYYMKKDSEDIYIIEYEEDKEKDSILEAEN